MLAGMSPDEIRDRGLLPAGFRSSTNRRRKSEDQGLGVTSLDCHANFHTNAAFHPTPDVRPQAARFRLDTVSLRGMFNQRVHGSKRSLCSVEDFSEFEQRTAYFNGDQVSAQRKGAHLPERHDQVSMMAQMQNMIDFPPAPKLDPAGRLDPNKASDREMAGERVFMGKGRCAECHVPQTSSSITRCTTRGLNLRRPYSKWFGAVA
jgi:cytochrome c peroxidase